MGSEILVSCFLKKKLKKMEIISDKDVKIRKPHRCLLCNRKFEVGTMMHNQVNKYDGIASVYTCLTCEKLMAYIEPNDDNMYESECLSEAMYHDNFGGTPEDYLDFKFKQNADRIKLQSECAHEKVKVDWRGGHTHNVCINCEKLIRKPVLSPSNQ